LLGVGFGLFLAGAYLIYGGRVGFLRGFLWGLGGFAVFQLAPALGLPPAVPGSPLADVTARQVWWVGTVVASVVGLALVVFSRRNLLRGVGVVVILLPHLIGAPHLGPGVTSPLPPELISRFILASLATTGMFWLFLGGLSGWLHSRQR
ncbi:MAG: CbtA family protein, partial [SAR324 cluster bacterium]|nr:CbtA family protein [SAR324 cluster bacterium]